MMYPKNDVVPNASSLKALSGSEQMREFCSVSARLRFSALCGRIHDFSLIRNFLVGATMVFLMAALATTDFLEIFGSRV